MTNKFLSALEAVGKEAVKVLGVADKIETNPEVQTLESLFLPPSVVKLISSGLDAVSGAEQQMAVAGFQDGTGAQKLQIAASVFTSDYAAYAEENNLPAEPETIVEITNLLSQVVNLIPAPTKGPAAVKTTVVPAAQTQPAAAASQAPATAVAASSSSGGGTPSPAPAEAAAAGTSAPAPQAQIEQPNPAPEPAPAPTPQAASIDQVTKILQARKGGLGTPSANAKPGETGAPA